MPESGLGVLDPIADREEEGRAGDVANRRCKSAISRRLVHYFTRHHRLEKEKARLLRVQRNEMILSFGPTL